MRNDRILTEGRFLPYLLHSEQRTTSDPGGFVKELRLTKDRKVSSWVSYGSSGKSRNVLPNTFGLSAGIENSCPGATDLCFSVCYAGRLETVYTTVGRMLAHNLAVLRACGDDVDAMMRLLVPLIERYLEEAGRRERRQGRTFPRLFRIHWDGDFFSAAYAHAWRQTIDRFPDVQFWTYTRSFTSRLNVVPILRGLKNFTLYLSVDAQNYRDAKAVLAEFPDTLVSVLSGTVEGGKAVYRALTGQNAAACPEKIGKLDIVTHRRRGRLHHLRAVRVGPQGGRLPGGQGDAAGALSGGGRSPAAPCATPCVADGSPAHSASCLQADHRRGV